MTKLLITGASGRVGSGLVRNLDSLFGDTYQIDLLENNNPLGGVVGGRRNLRVVKEIGRSYDLALHLASLTDIRYTSKPENRKEVREVNVGLTKRVCDASNRVVMLSSVHVFGGTGPEGTFEEDDIIAPLNFYGQTKAGAEEIVLASGGSVIRAQQIFGIKSRITDAVRPAVEGRDYWPFWTNRYLRPTDVGDLFRVVESVAKKGDNCVYHVSCEGDPVSRAEIAKYVVQVLREAGIPLKRDTFDTEEAKKPENLVLDTSKTREKLEIAFRPVGDTLKEHILKEFTGGFN